MALVTLAEAADHLRLDIAVDASPPEDYPADLIVVVDDASALITDYLKRNGESPPWSPSVEEAPIVRRATLLLVTALYDDRDGSGDGDYLAVNGPIARLLRRLRDPALA